MLIASFLLTSLILVTSCSGAGSSAKEDRQAMANSTNMSEQIVVPVFDADSAFYFIERQLAFGHRVPNTEAHRQTGDFLAARLAAWTDTVIEQHARVRAWDGTILQIRNIIGSFSPERRQRILLCAHWDTRPWADYDPDPANHYSSFDGANDGASGVGVLLEIARQMKKHRPWIGVDIIFFDAEDYGKHRLAPGADQDSWALGSQYWANNPHRIDYDARFGILLDMVGASNARFKKEGFSMLFAPQIVRKVWDTAERAGFGSFFIRDEGGFITDDHYYINTIRNIPTINIIHQDNSTTHGFFPQWHTMDDNIEQIDHASLKAVGQTVLNVVYQSR